MSPEPSAVPGGSVSMANASNVHWFARCGSLLAMIDTGTSTSTLTTPGSSLSSSVTSATSSAGTSRLTTSVPSSVTTMAETVSTSPDGVGVSACAVPPVPTAASRAAVATASAADR